MREDAHKLKFNYRRTRGQTPANKKPRGAKPSRPKQERNTRKNEFSRREGATPAAVHPRPHPCHQGIVPANAGKPRFPESCGFYRGAGCRWQGGSFMGRRRPPTHTPRRTQLANRGRYNPVHPFCQRLLPPPAPLWRCSTPQTGAPSPHLPQP